MTLKIAAAATMLLLLPGSAMAQTKPAAMVTAPAAMSNCPAPGTVDEAKLPPECKNEKGSLTQTLKPSTTENSGTADTTATGSITKPGTTETSGTADTTATGSITKPGTAETMGTADTTATSSTTVAPATPNVATGAASANVAGVSSGNSVLASDFIGQTVYTANGDNVGDITDLVMSRDLNNVVAVVGVGGFLGIGKKDVAISLKDINVSKDTDKRLHLTINMTKAQLDSAQAFDRTALR